MTSRGRRLAGEIWRYLAVGLGATIVSFILFNGLVHGFNTADFAPYAERLFAGLKDKPGKKLIAFIWAGAHPMAKFVDMKPERFGITL